MKYAPHPHDSPFIAGVAIAPFQVSQYGKRPLKNWQEHYGKALNECVTTTDPGAFSERVHVSDTTITTAFHRPGQALRFINNLQASLPRIGIRVGIARARRHDDPRGARDMGLTTSAQESALAALHTAAHRKPALAAVFDGYGAYDALASATQSLLLGMALRWSDAERQAVQAYEAEGTLSAAAHLLNRGSSSVRSLIVKSNLFSVTCTELELARILDAENARIS